MSGRRSEWRTSSPLAWLIGCLPVFNDLPLLTVPFTFSQSGLWRQVPISAFYSFTNREEEQSHYQACSLCCRHLELHRGIHEPSLPVKCILIRTILQWLTSTWLKSGSKDIKTSPNWLSHSLLRTEWGVVSTDASQQEWCGFDEVKGVMQVGTTTATINGYSVWKRASNEVWLVGGREQIS